MANGTEPSLTIDQLAQRTGMTVRNIRAHQSRHLLDPPDVRGRTGYYGRAHVERLELIRRLQADGYSLDLIGRMIVTASMVIAFQSVTASACESAGKPSAPHMTMPDSATPASLDLNIFVLL